MADLVELLQRCGREKKLSPGEVVCRQGAVSDGAYYVKRGRLGVYREDQDVSYLLSEIVPGNIVGELGATTGWSRTATVKAEEESCVIHISEADFRRLLKEAPALAAEVICQVGERLTHGDIARVTLGRSYQQAMERVRALRSEKERLEELLRLREELAGMIVHDLRNPLGVIASGMELLEGELDAETKSEYVDSLMETMGRSVWRMQRLVETLLDITHLEKGKIALHIAPVDVIALIEEVVTEERHLAENHGVALESIAPADIPLVMVDRDVVQRMLINLLDNALKFTPRGGRVWVDARPRNGQVQVEVLDTGPGIPLEEHERIFEKFTQTQGRIGGRRGLGLGLTFCRMAVEAHSGCIWVEDGPQGKGSCFVFTLPRSQEDGVR
ncbi:MAG: ATP-binding protein [Chloroflexota bacterium]|nr:ATP-binding protein [Chloroflexota bacterium]